MDIEDAALMYQGWGDQLLYEQDILRRMTMIIAEVTNKSFGGKGIMKNASKIWPMPGDDQKRALDLVDMLKKHNEMGLKNGLKSVKRQPITIEVKATEQAKKPTGKKNGKRGT